MLPLVLAAGAVTVATGRLSGAIRYLLPALLGFVAYVAARQYVVRFKLPVHYLPQLDADRLLGAGTVPTVWLEKALYHGHTGPLEVGAMIVYVSHFIVPLVLATALLVLGRNRELGLLVLSLLVAAVVSEIVFVAFPTAPPWMAAAHGQLTGVHHILKQTFADVGLRGIADSIGDPTKYDVTAAFPSLHVAFPAVFVLVARRARLPRPVVVLLWLNLIAVSFAVVYLGEHYVSDVLAGAVVGAASYALVRRLQ